MGEFCTSCGEPLDEGVKFCLKCGTAVLAAPAKVQGAANEILPQRESSPTNKIASPNKITPIKDFLGSKAADKIKTKVKKETKGLTEKILSDSVPAYGTAGEITLPQGLIPFEAITEGEGLFSVLKGGLSGLLSGFKGALRDKKRLAVVIALAITWLLVNFLASLGIFPLPIRFLSWLTAAQGSLIGGSIGKGLIAALLAQFITEQGVFQTVKRGLGQLGGMVKGSRGATGSLLIGLGVALIASNMMISSHLQNTMVCLAAFLLSAKALTHHGFLRKLINALLPKAKNTTLTTLMRGWTLGFALFAAVSFLPGGGNGYVLGILLILAGSIVTVVGRNKKEATAE